MSQLFYIFQGHLLHQLSYFPLMALLNPLFEVVTMTVS